MRISRHHQNIPNKITTTPANQILPPTITLPTPAVTTGGELFGPDGVGLVGDAALEGQISVGSVMGFLVDESPLTGSAPPVLNGDEDGDGG